MLLTHLFGHPLSQRAGFGCKLDNPFVIIRFIIAVSLRVIRILSFSRSGGALSISLQGDVVFPGPGSLPCILGSTDLLGIGDGD